MRFLLIGFPSLNNPLSPFFSWRVCLQDAVVVKIVFYFIAVAVVYFSMIDSIKSPGSSPYAYSIF